MSTLVNIFVITVCALVAAAGAALLLFVLWRHHLKRSRAPFQVFGARGVTETDCAPEGFVLVRGEMWAARTANGATLKCGARARITGAAGPLLLIEPET